MARSRRTCRPTLPGSVVWQPATAGPGVVCADGRVTAAQHVLCIRRAGAQAYYRNYALAPKGYLVAPWTWSAASYQGSEHGEQQRYLQRQQTLLVADRGGHSPS